MGELMPTRMTELPPIPPEGAIMGYAVTARHEITANDAEWLAEFIHTTMYAARHNNPDWEDLDDATRTHRVDVYAAALARLGVDVE